MNRLVVAFAILLIAFAVLSEAGWNDMTYSSPQDGLRIRQGDSISLTLVLSNKELLDGGAAYITNVTLLPGPCINNGTSITARGAIVCPDNIADQGCPARFRNSTLTNTFTFANLSTRASCQNGNYFFTFELIGNTEVGAGGQFAIGGRNASPRFTITLVGPHFCGDGTCESMDGENCTSCGQDCGECPVCDPGARTCIGDAVGECNASGFWVRTPCPGGCRLNITDEPECLPPCQTGSRECVAENVLATCESGKWVNSTCENGCLYGDCKGDCHITGCPESCSSTLHLFNGTCDEVMGVCSYEQESCVGNCDEAGIACAEAGGETPTPETPPSGGMDLTLPIVAVVVLALGAVAYLKFIRKPSGGMPPSQPPQPSQPAKPPQQPPSPPPAAQEQKPPETPPAPSPFKSIHEETN